MQKCRFAATSEYPSRQSLVDQYAGQSGREVTGLTWHIACTVWRIAIGLESLYGREREGKGDVAGLEDLNEEVLVLARRAASVTRGEFRMD